MAGPARDRRQAVLRAIVADGCDKARKYATETMRDVHDAMGLSYN